MTIKRLALVLSVSLLVSWLGMLCAGAAHPAPVGFPWIVLLDLVCAGLVYRRVPTYAARSAAGSSGRWLVRHSSTEPPARSGLLRPQPSSGFLPQHCGFRSATTSRLPEATHVRLPLCVCHIESPDETAHLALLPNT